MMKAALVFFCGIAVTLGAPNTRIVGGLTAPKGAFPYQISLRIDNYHTCGGSIVNPTTILTAAHCVDEIRSVAGLTVVVGTTTLNDGGMAYPVSETIVHPSYDAETVTNDIAIVKLYAPISYNRLVRPITLATNQPAGGEVATVSGWGLTYYPGEQTSNSLQYLNLRILDLNTCAQMNPTSAPITYGQVCTTSPRGQGVCSGDSGGPLVVNGVQVAVVSWVVPCAQGFPDIFTSVAYYRDWIAQYEY